MRYLLTSDITKEELVSYYQSENHTVCAQVGANIIEYFKIPFLFTFSVGQKEWERWIRDLGCKGDGQ